MTKAYWVATYRSIKNSDSLSAYVKAAVPAIEAAGGRVLARGIPTKAYEQGVLERVVLIEFESAERASAAYESATYQAARKLLADGAERDIRIIEAMS